MKTLLKAAPIALAAALAGALCLPPQARSADLSSGNTVQPPPAYPLKKSANGRYLVDSKGAPFLLAGDAPQALMVKLTEADADLYFSNRVAHGFNAVWINLLCRPGTGGRNDGATYDGILPFTTTDDLSAPNEAYFARCDRMLALAQNHGLLVILDPAETIDHLKILVANGPEKCRAFGRYLGQRYKRFPNLLWMSGNDFQNWRDPKNDEVALAVAQGLREADPDHLQTVELNYEVSGSLDDPKWEPVIGISCAYTYYPTYAQVLKEYNRTNFLPVIMIESDYEFEQRATPAVLRREEYWSILAGAAGQVYGSGPIWPFADNWKGALDSIGAVQMAWVKALFEPRPWFDLVPDQRHKLVVAGYGTFDGASNEGNHYVMTSDYVTAGRTPDGRLAIAYMPSLRPLKIDLSQLRKPVTARWYDPSRGTFSAIKGSPFPNSGQPFFIPPGNNADGDGDWLLVLEDATLSAGLHAGQAAENLLKDGGFEQYLDPPDEQGNPFKVWSGWKWEGNCKRLADTDIKHDGQASAQMLSYGPCKLGLSQTVKTESGWYKLSGYVRTIELKPGQYDRGLVISFEPKGKEIMTDLPTGTCGWRKFELTRQFDEPCERNLLYIYLFGSGKVWLDELRLEKVQGAGLKNGLVLGPVEETLRGFPGGGGIPCPFCGLKVDPKAAKCSVCGEPTSGWAGFSQANETLAKVTALIAQAKARGVDVLYWQAAAIPMRVGLDERWKSFPEERPETLRYVEARGPEIIREITSVLSGKTQPRQAPPKPEFARMKLKGRNFCQADVPTFIYSVHSGPAQEAEPFFTPHTSWVYTCMAPGADRFNYKEMPIWEAFNQYPDTHRLWDGGWCGHIIADKWSGGVSGANCVICLESPHTRRACVEAYRKILPPQMQSQTRLVSLLDYEYFYICYCDATGDLFRAWLKEKFDAVEKLNRAWDTRHNDFAEVQLPDYRRREPNDAKRYDWLDFNLWRFTQFMKWAKAQQRQIDPGIPMATCAPHYNFTKEWGESGSDVEALAREVNDFCINESPASTKYVDFLRSLSDNRKAIVEVEGSEYRNTMASFLHGLSALSLYWGWADKPGDGGALLYGRGSRPPYCTLPEAERFLRTGLDLRRLRKEILAFQQDLKAPVALLYSRASLLQVPETGGDKTPYLLELERTYDALLEIGVPIDFITTRQVLEGKLPQYHVLVIPAATYEQAEVVQRVIAFARSGGQVVLVPNSWFFDQYNRKQDYLGSLNLQVTGMKAPKIVAGQAKTGLQRDAAGEETEAPFLMGLIVDSVVTDVPKAAIKTLGSGVFPRELELQGAGVRHVLKVGGDNRVLASFSDRLPAIVQVPMDKGSIHYLAIPLLSDSMVEFMDGVLAGCGAQGPVRFLTPDGKHVSGLEYRAIQTSDGWLAFVNNLDRKADRQVKLAASLKFSRLRNLTLESDLPPSFIVPAGETYILKLTP